MKGSIVSAEKEVKFETGKLYSLVWIFCEVRRHFPDAARNKTEVISRVISDESNFQLNSARRRRRIEPRLMSPRKPIKNLNNIISSVFHFTAK